MDNPVPKATCDIQQASEIKLLGITFILIPLKLGRTISHASWQGSQTLLYSMHLQTVRLFSGCFGLPFQITSYLCVIL